MPQVIDQALDSKTLDQVFCQARTHSSWLDQPVSTELMHRLYHLVKFGPTSANCSPARFIFVHSAAARDRLLLCMAPGNVAKTEGAPLTVLVGYDREFYEKLPQLYPHLDARSWFAGNQALIEESAFRNSSLQGAYLILAARALGLDCGPMSGFEATKVDQEFFPDGKCHINFMCNIGYGDNSVLPARSPRLSFGQACQIR